MPLLKDIAPHLREEWNLSKNSSLGVYFDTITSTAMKRVWWCCQKDSRHNWQSLVRDRANGRGCPYCFGLQVLPEESFGHLHPALCAEIDATKNSEFDPYKTTPGAKIQIWWRCSAQPSHSWRSAIRTRTKNDHGCPHCRTASKSLGREAPEFLAEWHPEKNLPNTPETVLASSTYKAWWRCTTNPEHIWQAQVRSRVDGKSKCPLCRNTQPQERLPSLSEFSPELANQWHPTKNGLLNPSQVTVGSHRKVWWQCPKDSSHEWDAGVRNRARLARGCPFCPTTSGRISRGQSLAEKFPLLALQWHTEKNGNLSPKQILPGSAKRVWWRCNSTPCHEWESTIYNRTSKQPNGDCPFCKGTRLSDSNSLAVVHPNIAAEWHPTLNGPLSPADVTRASGRRVWWKCSKDPSHEWETIIRARTIQKSGCPLCDIESRSDRLQQAQLDSALSNQNSLKTFQSHMRSVNSLIRQISPSSIHSTQAFYRMVYASIITAVEAYLSDTFYCLVITDPARTERLLTTAPEFLEKKYSVVEVLDWHKNLASRLSDYLYGIAWHNLRKVRPMYETVLNVSFPKNSGALHRAVTIRHDIVHRNGRSKDHRSHRFSAKDVHDLISVAEEFVNELEVQLKPRR